MSVTNKNAMLLGDGWKWVEYDDGSGHLENPNGKSVISFDYTTQEYRDLHGEWKFMDNYPDSTPLSQFKTDIENTIVAEEFASYSAKVKSIVELENQLDVTDDYSILKDGRFRDWNLYAKLDEIEKVLSDYRIALNEPNVFDLGIADSLCDLYGVNETALMLTDNQKELVVIGVECEQDWNNIVSPNLKLIYDEIISEQAESETHGAEMQM